MWFMLKALGVDSQWLKADSKRLIRGAANCFGLVRSLCRYALVPGL